MKIVIEIDDARFKDIRRIACVQLENYHFKTVEQIIANGTPLPKGHGRLKDVDALLDIIGLEDNDSNREDNVGAIVTLEDFDSIPTIIEADKESEE